MWGKSWEKLKIIYIFKKIDKYNKTLFEPENSG